MTRLLVLYLRSRQVPVALPAAVLAVAALALLGNDPDRPMRTLAFVVVALGLGFGVLGQGLGGPSAALERTAAICWVSWRAGHAVAITVLVLVVGLATTTAPVGTVVRDAAGLAGLTALAAAVLGHQLAWALPVAWAGAAAAVPAVPGPPVLSVLTWPTQPPDSTTAAVTAGALAGAGLVTYAVHGSRS
jgi:hypothetical protein